MKLALLVLVIVVVVLIMAIVIQQGRIAYLKRKVADQQKVLNGIEDPMVWLSDDDRRTYARELLERERARYQDNLLNQQYEQVKQFTQYPNPTIQKKDFNQ